MSSGTALTQLHRESVAERSLGPLRRPSRAGLAAIILLVIVGSGMIFGYVSTQRQVDLIINDRRFPLRTHQTSVAAVLEESGIQLSPEDVLLSPPDAPLTGSGPIVIRKALPVKIDVDGRTLELRTHTQTVADLLREAGITVSRYDEVVFEGEDAGPEVLLAVGRIADLYSSSPRLHPAELWKQQPLRLVVHRAKPVTVYDGGVPITVHTTAATVGQALFEDGVILYLGDSVKPSLGARVLPGMQVYVQRSKALVIFADGQRIKTRSHGETVEAVLKQESIELVGRDYVIPDQSAETYDNMAIKVVRVQEQVVLEEEPIPFETFWRPDEALQLDRQRLDQVGAAGLKRRLVRVVYENGEETERITEEEWVETPPTSEIIAYGTKIVIREQQMPEGTVTYWRKFRALATAYTASTAGTPPDAPWYGRTYMGLPARKGIIAVDWDVIPLGTKMYVPGYGFGMAGDRGVKGRHVDLCYDEGTLPAGVYRWVDVYLLTPVPPRDKIRWILPSYPRER